MSGNMASGMGRGLGGEGALPGSGERFAGEFEGNLERRLIQRGIHSEHVLLPRETIPSEDLAAYGPYFGQLPSFERFDDRSRRSGAPDDQTKPLTKSQEVYRETKRLGLLYGRRFIDFFRESEGVLPGMLTPDDVAVLMVARSWFGEVGQNFRMNVLDVRVNDHTSPRPVLTFECDLHQRHFFVGVCPHWATEDDPQSHRLAGKGGDLAGESGPVSEQLCALLRHQAAADESRGTPGCRTLCFVAASPEEFFAQLEGTEFAGALQSNSPHLGSRELKGILAGVARAICRRERKLERKTLQKLRREGQNDSAAPEGEEQHG